MEMMLRNGNEREEEEEEEEKKKKKEEDLGRRRRSSTRIASILSNDPNHYKRRNISKKGRPSKPSWPNEFSSSLKSSSMDSPASTWTDTQLKTLLKGISQYGTRDLRKLESHLGKTKSLEAIRTIIEKYKKSQILEAAAAAAAAGYGDQKLSSNENHYEEDEKEEEYHHHPAPVNHFDSKIRNPIETWISVFENLDYQENETLLSYPKSTQGPWNPPLPSKKTDMNPSIPIFLDWIANYEDHPSTSETGGVDYALIYSNIGNFCTGDIPKEMNDATKAKFMELMMELKDEIKEQLPNLQKETIHLSGPRCNPYHSQELNSHKNGADFSQISKEQFKQFSSLRGANPLQLPQNFIDQPNIFKSSFPTNT